MRSGTASPRRPSAPLTGATASSSSPWPTPRAQDSKHGAATEWELNTDHAGTKNSLRVHVVKRAQWPTPTAATSGPDYARATRPGSGGDDLVTAVAKTMWPTPTAQDWSPTTGELYETSSGTVRLRRKDGRTSRIGLEASARLWPTPNARDWKDTGPTQGKRKSPNLGTMVHGPDQPATGSLNPTWVEWLMGFPAGWTDCED